jgi:WD40 repeat protein
VARVLPTPDGKTLVVAEVHWSTGEAKTTLWDPSTGERQGELGGVRALALSPGGRTLATSTWKGKLQLWDVATRQATMEVQTASRGLADEMLTGAFSPDGQILAIGSRNSLVNLWTGAELREVATLHEHCGSVRSVAFSPDGRRLASVSDDLRMCLWDPRTRSLQGVLAGHAYRVWSVAFAPDGRTVATACGDRTVRLWDLSQTGGQMALPLPSGSGSVTSVAILPHGETVVTTGGDRQAGFWNLKTGELEGPCSPMSGDPSVAVAVSPVQRLLAIGTAAGHIHLRDLDTGNEGTTIPAHETKVVSLAFSPDGRLLASTELSEHINNSRMKLWDPATGKELFHLRSQEGRMGTHVDTFSPDGKTLASQVGHDVRFLDLNTFQTSQLRTAHLGFVCCLAYSPDGRILATGSADRTIKLLEPQTGQERATLLGHRDFVTALAFSPDGKTLVSGSRNGELKLWDVFTGRELFPLSGHTGVCSIVFSADGTRMVTAGGAADRSGEVSIWRAPKEVAQ